jgi:hypothetical protein
MCSYIATMDLRQRWYVVVFGVFDLFSIDGLILLFVALVDILGMWMLSLLFIKVWCLCLACRTLKWV